MFSKHENIASVIVDDLNEDCMCGIESSDVDERSFVACDEQLDEYVTFRARLSGTSDKSSKYLITLLEEWVSTGPVIIVEGVLVKVENSELSCSTVLTDFKEKSCLKDYEPSTETPDSSGITQVTAVGASIATIVGTLLTFLTICSSCICWFIHRRKKKKRNDNQELKDMSHLNLFGEPETTL